MTDKYFSKTATSRRVSLSVSLSLMTTGVALLTWRNASDQGVVASAQVEEVAESPLHQAYFCQPDLFPRRSVRYLPQEWAELALLG